MSIKMSLKTLYKFLLRGYKANSEIYIRYLRKKGVRIGKNCQFHDPVSTFVDTDKPYMITIGNNVHITHGVTIVAHGYDWIVLAHKYGGHYASAGEVKIGNNVFIGMDSTILKGAVIGDNVIIGAGSLVTSEIPSDCVAVGRPAKKVMSLEEYKAKKESTILNEACLAYLAAKERNVFENIKSDWEFNWIFNSECKDSYFSNIEEFENYVRRNYESV